ncbi:Tetratricopeptide repeat protein [Maioricimonas rarisocia]|uniref:Tetratricopeptide repeat protein n=1 Tax=Maioricimonas rarisocia TaxID=2528026 RepID=A0A517ZBQ0_9PLAN|nr:tetratricopeptide repeat protein [Maioricimonas rarisocia]QDU39887.1 Tetratricopeptide repeat protein [Maioricimonas rarisocia]
MLRSMILTVCFGMGLLVGADAAVAQGVAGRDYPKVYGPTGRLYGPTQAHYQYRRQYGRDWHGYNGLQGGPEVGAVNGYPAGGSGYGGPGYHHHGNHVDVLVPAWGLWGGAGGYGWSGPWGYQGYDPGSSAGYHVVPAPVMPWSRPAIHLPSGVNSPVLEDAARENAERWKDSLDVTPPTPKQILPPSTDQAKLASMRKEHSGDLQMQQRNYAAAAERYRDAIRLAEDRPEPRFRLAIAETSRANFEEAVKEFKTLLRLHPDWAVKGPTLDSLFGDDGLLAKTLVQERLIDWVKEDIRDPDRLFLMGAILYYDNQFDRAETVLETAARLGGAKPHLRSLLGTLVNNEPVAAAGGGQGPGDNQAGNPVPGGGAPVLPPLPNDPDRVE